MYLKFAKVHANSRSPERANPSDAGLDVFYSPDAGESKAHPSGKWIMPSESARFKTGLRFEVPHGYMLQAMNRSSMAASRNLIVGACVIDSGYSGQVFIDLHNVGHDPQLITSDAKIAQLVLMPINAAIPIEVGEDEIYQENVTISNRGEGSLGSTDKK